jgi:hypothetical protein
MLSSEYQRVTPEAGFACTGHPTIRNSSGLWRTDMDEHEAGYETPGSIAEDRCSHHWLIEPPKGPTSMGVCKLCGARKEFDNQLKLRNSIEASSQSLEATTPQEECEEEEL